MRRARLRQPLGLVHNMRPHRHRGRFALLRQPGNRSPAWWPIVEVIGSFRRYGSRWFVVRHLDGHICENEDRLIVPL